MSETLLLFSVAGDQYGVPVDKVKRLVRLDPPGSPGRYEESLLPLVQVGPGTAAAAALAVIADGPIALAVDTIDGLIVCPDGALNTLPVASSLVDRAGTVDGRIIVTLDLTRLER